VHCARGVKMLLMGPSGLCERHGNKFPLLTSSHSSSSSLPVTFLPEGVLSHQKIRFVVQPPTHCPWGVALLGFF
jgi:hypothetical protein